MNIENTPLPCPKCGKHTEALKCYSLPNYLLFLGVYAAYSFEKKVLCPSCMRKQILIKYFTYNIVIGNFLWLLMGLPMGLWKLGMSFTDDHSKTVQNLLLEHQDELFSQEEQHYDAQGNPIYNQEYNV